MLDHRLLHIAALAQDAANSSVHGACNMWCHKLQVLGSMVEFSCSTQTVALRLKRMSAVHGLLMLMVVLMKLTPGSLVYKRERVFRGPTPSTLICKP